MLVAFDAIAAPTDPGMKGERLADYDAVAKVFVHPRCTNCHAAADWPRQGDGRQRHAMNVWRGPDGTGVAGARCVSCHAPSGVARVGAPPSAENWRMPSEDQRMVFEGRTARELCLQLKDPAATGRRSLGEALEHVLHDSLVSWAFEPGGGRSTPPLAKAEFFAILARWARGGAPCPES